MTHYFVLLRTLGTKLLSRGHHNTVKLGHLFLSNYTDPFCNWNLVNFVTEMKIQYKVEWSYHSKMILQISYIEEDSLQV